MKLLYKSLGIFAAAAATLTLLMSATPSTPIKVGVVNFKVCVEESKLGKQEQASFESLKKQIESILEEKEKSLNEIASKLGDEDYMDGLSTDAENELKHKFRNMSQELNQLQQQFYQSLQQANFKIMQNMHAAISQTSDDVAKKHNLDLIVNEEGTFFYQSGLDVSKDVVAAMDAKLEEEKK